MAVSAAWAAVTATAASVASSVEGRREAKNTKGDQERARKQAELDTANKANARVMMQRQAMRDNNLLTGGAARETLGVG